MENQQIQERYKLTIERMYAILEEDTVAMKYQGYFQNVAKFILDIYEIWKRIQKQKEECTEEQLRRENYHIYRDILEEHYEESYANPAYAVDKMGKEIGQLLSFLYTEIRNEIAFVYEQRLQYLTIYNELFIEIYNCFEHVEQPEYKELKDIIYWFMSDYCDVILADRIAEQLDTTSCFAVEILKNRDLNNLSYLYEYGEYISQNERKTAEYLNTLPEETIDQIASVYVEGYCKGFQLAGIDLSKKETVDIRYTIGFERVILKAIQKFEEMGLHASILRGTTSVLNKKVSGKIGFLGGEANKQYEFDHRYDQGLFLDKKFMERKLDVIKNVYEHHKESAAKFAGPAVMETFGEEPFLPILKEECIAYTEQQEHLAVTYNNRLGQLVNQYIKGDERSYTIIAFPIPEIGEEYKDIFNEVIKINTLDADVYEKIQQTMIDVLDQGEFVHVKGKGKNRTDLYVKLCDLRNPEKETKFENCVADVNIPVGEVFTSPVLKGTNGVLHVKKVYLNGLQYVDLMLQFEDGMITDYTCKNMESEEENRRFIKHNLLHNHDTLPMGEFAIGTNTTAYMVGKKYGIEDKFPILIAEKTGPHFAIGDTCYSWSEENKVYNPNGKEIIAKDNEVSKLRTEDISKAYFQCHTDITIPYDELESISVVTGENKRMDIIKDGRFVLDGTEALNAPLE